MPGGDGTGPAGLGPMTGRAAGYCAGFPAPGFANAVPRGGRFGYAPYYGGYAPGYPVGGGVPYAPYYGYTRPYYGYAGYGAFPRLGLGWGRGRGRRFW